MTTQVLIRTCSNDFISGIPDNESNCLFFQKTKSFLDAMKMHEKFFYKSSSEPQWSEERQFDNVEAFHKYANTAGN